MLFPSGKVRPPQFRLGRCRVRGAAGAGVLGGALCDRELFWKGWWMVLTGC